MGLGLIGGSLGLAFSSLYPEIEVAGYDRDASVSKQAVEMGCVHRCGELEATVKDADYVFICTPIGIISRMAEEIAGICRPGCIITDAGSTKQTVAETFERLQTTGIIGIGGHPMAGSEHQGITGADRYLFENAVYILTPGKNTPDDAVQALASLIRLTGAHVMLMDARLHDQSVAAASHLPHLAASALVAVLGGQDDAMALTAGGFRDTTRVASGDPGLWAEILMSNQRAVIPQVDLFIEKLLKIKGFLEDNRQEELCQFLESARCLRETLPARQKGLATCGPDIIVLVPDQPGIIGSLGSWLGEAGINITDIEILRVREGDGGTIRIAIGVEDEGGTAVEALRQRGIKAWMR